MKKINYPALGTGAVPVPMRLRKQPIKNKQRKSLLNWMVSGDEVGLSHSEQCIRFISLNLRWKQWNCGTL